MLFGFFESFHLRRAHFFGTHHPHGVFAHVYRLGIVLFLQHFIAENGVDQIIGHAGGLAVFTGEPFIGRFELEAGGFGHGGEAFGMVKGFFGQLFFGQIKSLSRFALLDFGFKAGFFLRKHGRILRVEHGDDVITVIGFHHVADLAFLQAESAVFKRFAQAAVFGDIA